MRTVRLLTYNVHEAVGTGRQQSYQRISEVIKEINPDIINLQEVDSELNEKKNQQSFLFETINETFEYYGIKGITMIRSRSAYGNAIFLKNKPLEIRRHDISFDNREPRGILDCMIQLNDSTLRVINTHFGLKKKERSSQIQILKQLVVQKNENHPILLSGDFNEWNSHSNNLKALREVMNMVPSEFTFPAKFPLFALDRIFYKGKIELLNSKRHKSPLSLSASDHLPIVAEFALT
jgi:endonuclease/exonuclease/phosphatase family metal-dependent hydrolase